MYYINSLYFYSLIGFIMESTVYKISKSQKQSGICYGPYTFVYGFGVLVLILLKKYFLDKLTINKYLKLFITFTLCAISLTFIEWIGGNIINIIFEIDMWDYSKKICNFGKYICLELSIIWGILGTLYIYYIKDFFDKIIELIPKRLSIFIIIINVLDIIIVFINKVF